MQVWAHSILLPLFLPIISPFFFYQPVELFSLMFVKNLFPKVAQCSRDKTELPVSPEIYSALLYPTIDTVHALYHWVKPGVVQATYKRLHPPFIESVFKMLLQRSAQDNAVIPQKLWTCWPYILSNFDFLWSYMQNTQACDCFIGLASRIDFVDVMSDVTCSWSPRQAAEDRSLQRYKINISIDSVTELL